MGLLFYQNVFALELKQSGARITEFVTEDGTGFRAKMFIDATYEGDLMAKAGVSYTLMREGNAKYGERYNGIYYDANGDFGDNPVRYAFLSAAAVEWAATQPPFDIIHSHDWQGGLASIYARRLGAPGTVFTIHNLAYQGVFDKAWVPRLGLPWDGFTHDRGFEFFDRLSFLKAGINSSGMVTTVSPTYAQEIQRPEYGYGFDGIMRARQDALVGILNGIDPDEWNPMADPYLPAAFDAEHLEGKAAAKRAGSDLTATAPVNDRDAGSPTGRRIGNRTIRP